jgi:hypothetical protein
VHSEKAVSSAAYSVAQEELLFLGDILCAGIIKKGLLKVGSTPDIASSTDVKKALDQHIGPALVSFVGPSESQKIIQKIRGKLDKLQPAKGVTK